MLEQFEEILLVDFEYRAPAGERPEIRCMVVREFRSGRVIRLWKDELENLTEAPFRSDKKVLFVSYLASAELACFLQLHWKLPDCILDLYVEFRRHANGILPAKATGLLAALNYFGLDSIGAHEKSEMRELAMRSGNYYTAEERDALLAYCESDVTALARLLPCLAPKSDLELQQALHRGRYMKVVARMEHRGIPIDAEMLFKIRQNWKATQLELIARVDHEFNVFEGVHFRFDKFARYLIRNHIAWPRTNSSRLASDDDSFKSMARLYPQIEPLRKLRSILGQMRLGDLAVGSDNRNRCMLSPFAARTGRNLPSSTRFIFGCAKWLRPLIQPEPGTALAYLDFASEEFCIAARLSGDDTMLDAYEAGDPYFAFGQQANLIPHDGTVEKYRAVRDLCKTLVLATGYGEGPRTLSDQLSRSEAEASYLLNLHRRLYAKFWSWGDRVERFAAEHGYLETMFGWRLHVGRKPNPRMVRNFPVQGAGAELLRLACILASERGVQICCPVHDAILCEAPADEIEGHVAMLQEAMNEASRVVLDGYVLRTDCKLIRYPDRFSETKGKETWETVCSILNAPPRHPAVQPELFANALQA